MSLIYFGLITAGILFLALAYVFIFSVQFSMSDDRLLFIRAFFFALVAMLLNGAYFLDI